MTNKYYITCKIGNKILYVTEKAFSDYYPLTYDKDFAKIYYNLEKVNEDKKHYEKVLKIHSFDVNIDFVGG